MRDLVYLCTLQTCILVYEDVLNFAFNFYLAFITFIIIRIKFKLKTIGTITVLCRSSVPNLVKWYRCQEIACPPTNERASFFSGMNETNTSPLRPIMTSVDMSTDVMLVPA